MIYLLIFLVILLNCIGQICQKYAAKSSICTINLQYRVRLLSLSLLLISSAMLVWLWILQQLPIGEIYPILSFNFVFITLSARWLWHESISLRHGFGLILIILGTIFIGLNV